jgi:hypothetical protein
MTVGRRGMFVGLLAVLVRRSGVLLGFFMLAELVVMLRLMMMMRCGVVVRGRRMMMFSRWMLR